MSVFCLFDPEGSESGSGILVLPPRSDPDLVSTMVIKIEKKNLQFTGKTSGLP